MTQMQPQQARGQSVVQHFIRLGTIKSHVAPGKWAA